MPTTCVQILNKIIVEAGFCDICFTAMQKKSRPKAAQHQHSVNIS